VAISIESEPDSAPPRNQITVEVPVGAIMSSVAIYRTDPGGMRALIGQQPVPGLDSRIVHDYEMPYGVPVVYDWETSYVDTAQIETLWTEAWASLAAWTTSGASWSVSGGKLVWTGSDSPSASVTRILTAGLYRFVFDAVPMSINTIDFGGFSIDVKNSRIVAGSQALDFLPGTTGWTVTMSPTSITITTSAGTFSFLVSVQATKVAFVGPVSLLTYLSDWYWPTGTGTGLIDAGSSAPFAIDSTGRIFIADTIARKIVVFDSAGTYLTSFGSSGSGDGQFGGIGSIIVDSAFNVFVGASNRIQKFTIGAGPVWTYNAQVGTHGSGDAQFLQVPTGLALDATNRVYAVDAGTGHIQRFTNNLVFIDRAGSLGTGPGQFPDSLTSPIGGLVSIGVDTTTGNVYTADSSRVQVFNSALVYQKIFAPQGTSEGSLFYPARIIVNGGIVYVTSETVDPLTPDRTAVNPTWLDSPRRVSKFLTDGTFLSKDDTIIPSYNAAPAGVRFGAVDPSGNLVVANLQSDRLLRYSQPKASIDDLATYSYGSLVAVNEAAASATINPDGDRGWIIHVVTPGLSFPLGYEDADQSSIQEIGEVVQQSTSTLHRIMGDAPPISVSTGPRASDQLPFVIATETSAEREALEALLRDQVPVLFRFPASWDLDFEEGYYDVGDVRSRRALQLYGVHAREHTLPLTSVERPDVTQANTGWSYAALLVAWSSYESVRTGFATYADVQVNNPVGS